MLDHNELWTALTGEVPGRGSRSTNLVWRSFHGDEGRVRHPFPEEYKKSLVADLRDVAIRYPADRELAGMIGALRGSSPEFARMWESPEVAHHGNKTKIIDHPALGELELDCDVMSVHGADLRIIIFTAAPESEAASKLQLLTVLGTETMTAPAEH